MERLDKERLIELIQVGRGLVSELDPETVLQQVLEVGRRLTGARYAALGILDRSGEGLERFVTQGIDDETRALIGDLPRGRGVLGALIQDPRPLRLDEVSSDPRSYGFPPGHPPMHTFLGVPIRVRGEVWGNLYLTDKHGGGSFTDSDEVTAIVLADWTAIAVENSRLYQRALERHADLERAFRELRATSDIARAVGGETDLDRILELIVKRGRALVEARCALIYLRQGPELVAAASAGEVPTGSRAGRLPVDGTRIGRVLASGRPERTPAAEADTAPDEPKGARAELLVPLIFRGERHGVLCAFDPTDGRDSFGAEDERLLISFAASGATAVGAARTVAAERLRESMQAAEEERRRWARELHDGVLQGLAGVRVSLSASLAGGREPLERAVEDGISRLADEIRALRALIAELRPPALDELGLVAALESLAGRSRSDGLDVRLEVELHSSDRLDPDSEEVVYRVVQEALTNVRRHANARSVQVRVRDENGSLVTEVSDDGEGFTPAEATESSGFGLRGMRERTELAGGQLTVDSTPGQGTRIALELPGVRRQR